MVLLFYTLYSFSTDFLVKWIDNDGRITQHTYTAIISLFTLVEFTSFSVFYKSLFPQRIFRLLITGALFVFIPFCLIHFYLQYNQAINLDTIPVIFQAIIFMLLSIFYFFDQIKTPTSLFIYHTFEFWIVTGILVYLAGTFFIYLFSAKLTPEELNQYWFINYIFNIFKNCCFSLAFLWSGRKRHPLDPEITMNPYKG
ncbi:MAG: hypothetical protein ACKO6K_01550 [Chitinophagaceae bacterium]